MGEVSSCWVVGGVVCEGLGGLGVEGWLGLDGGVGVGWRLWEGG